VYLSRSSFYWDRSLHSFIPRLRYAC